MLIKGVLHYRTEDRNVDFVSKKILEYIDGFVMQNVLGVLTDMAVSERRFERSIVDKNSIEIVIDTFGVDLEENESEEVELSLRESFSAIIDSPFIKDNEEEVFIKDPEMTVSISESESGED